MPVVVRRRAGKNGRMTIGGIIVYTAKVWEVTEIGDDLDGSSFESAGFEEGDIGIQVCRVRAELWWNAAQNPHDVLVGLYPRADLADVKLFENVADNIFWWLPLARVLECVNTNNVRQLIGYNVSLKSNGPYVPPAGSIL
jgi:hypothetical protein